MIAAKQAGHYDPAANDPDLEFGTQVTEYIYWAMSSVLGAQDFPGRDESIEQEWALNTLERVQSQDMPFQVFFQTVIIQIK